jgi:hypothetical protein
MRPGIWPHTARDWRGGVVFPHTTPEGCLMNLYGRAVGPKQVPTGSMYLPGAKGFNAAALQAEAARCGSAGADALALLAAGVPRGRHFGVQGWRWTGHAGARAGLRP